MTLLPLFTRALPRALLAATGALAAAGCATAQDAATLTFEGRTWETSSEDVVVTPFAGRDALHLKRASAKPSDLVFGDGVLEYDVAASEASGFVGLAWRIVDDLNTEQFYVRFHQSGHPDATQYMPVFNGVSAWQIHAGPNDAAAVDLPPGEWIHVKIVAEGDRADIYVGDADAPLLHVPHLRGANVEGPIELFAFDRPEMDTGAYFSHVSARPLRDGEHVVGAPKETAPLPDGLMTSWSVSTPFAEDQVAGGDDLDAIALPELAWTPLEVEDNGIANLARVATRAPETNTVLVKTVITAEADTTRMLAFGYSDRVHLYLNGTLLFAGNAAWRARDHRFLGTVGWQDQAPLRLKAGDNELVAAVSETFGGWAFTGAIADQDGLTITP